MIMTYSKKKIHKKEQNPVLKSFFNLAWMILLGNDSDSQT